MGGRRDWRKGRGKGREGEGKGGGGLAPRS